MRPVDWGVTSPSVTSPSCDVTVTPQVIDLPVGQMVITPLVGGVASVFIPISPVFLLPYFSILTPAFSAVHF